MDKVLAFSIMSASPADISAGAAGFGGGSWATRLSWRRGADHQHAAAAAQQKQQREDQMEDRQKRGSPRSRSRDGREHASGGGRAAAAPRFAPEFDCFETIVSH